ncbi:MAG: hypothetical protein KDA80_04480, partial [Planctomycetaceae bacterium]|nr:hypothetical protein [Planctomycetaceae bacterium]
EIARPEYSQLVPVNDVEALAKAIEETLHPDYRDGAKCYQPRTWSDCASEVTQLFKELIAKRRHKHSSAPRSPSNRRQVVPQ